MDKGRCDTKTTSGWILGRISSKERVVMHWHCCPGSGGVTIPGGVLEPWRCGTEGCGQWLWWGGGLMVRVIVKVFSNFSDSMIL